MTKRMGRPMKVRRDPRTARDILRRHLYEEGKTISGDLANIWGMTPKSALRRMYEYRRTFTPRHIQQFVEGMGLDEFDAAELYLQAAIEAGWPIQIDKLKV